MIWIVARDAVFMCLDYIVGLTYYSLDDWFDDAFDKSHINSKVTVVLALNKQTLDRLIFYAGNSSLKLNLKCSPRIHTWKKEGATI